MGQNVTIGGERLGSGKKMKAYLHGYERSTHNMGYLWRSTMSAGTLVPFLCEVALPGDTFDIELDCDIKTHPTLGPLFGSYKVQMDLFQAPIRLYQAFLHNNALNIGRNMANIKLPQISLPVDVLTNAAAAVALPDLDNSQINPSCLLSYLGIRGVGLAFGTPPAEQLRNFNAIPILAYWEIYKQYYANKQEEQGAVVHWDIPTIGDLAEVYITKGAGVEILVSVNPAAPTQQPVIAGNGFRLNYVVTAPDLEAVIVNIEGIGLRAITDIIDPNSINDTGSEIFATYNDKYGARFITFWRSINSTDTISNTPTVSMFPLDNIDDMRMEILKHDITVFNIATPDLEPYKWLYSGTAGRKYRMGSQEGLAIKTYQSDLLNNWISTDWIDGAGGIAEVSAVDVSGGLLTMDALNLSKKVYDMLNRIAISGGTYDDWLDTVYDHDRYQRAESPIYHGGLIKELVFQEVVSNSESTTGQPLGTLAGKGIMGKKHKGGKAIIKVDEPSYIMGIISLTPRIDYSQGNKWDVHLQTMDDFHKPALDEIGFQELITEQMAWWETHYDAGSASWLRLSAGKQPAWINYMTNISRTYGNFAIRDNEMFMTLNRRFEPAANAQITDVTTYIDPAKFNFIFAETSLDAQNFWAQIAVDMTVRRKMSAKIMPNL